MAGLVRVGTLDGVTTPKQARVRAPELVGAGGWLNTGGKDLSLQGLLTGKTIPLLRITIDITPSF